jgi:hypothetical protein
MFLLEITVFLFCTGMGRLRAAETEKKRRLG